MTLDQFKKHKWSANTHCEYRGTIYLVIAVDFTEQLIGVRNPLADDAVAWVRCENVNLNVYAVPAYAKAQTS